MNAEYEYIVTIEIKATDDKKEKEVLKKFKREIFSKYGSMDGDVMVTQVKLR